jgi:hypothetical protein
MTSSARRTDIGRTAFNAALPHLDGGGTLADLSDLVPDLLHLADTLPGQQAPRTMPDFFEDGSNGEYVVGNALALSLAGRGNEENSPRSGSVGPWGRRPPCASARPPARP